MRLLLDQDVYIVTRELLRRLGHDVVSAYELELARANDEDLLRHARTLDRIFVTRDRDYGALVFVHRIITGVLYLRMLPLTEEAVHQELVHVLELYSEEKLKYSYVVIDVEGHRIGDLT